MAKYGMYPGLNNCKSEIWFNIILTSFSIEVWVQASGKYDCAHMMT